MKKLTFLILVLAMGFPALLSAGPPATNAKLLFKSGFEEAVSLGHLKHKTGRFWTQDLTGSDVPGFSWPLTLWQAKEHFVFTLLSSDTPHPTNEANTRIETVIGHHGTPTRALYLDQLLGGANSQNEYYLQGVQEQPKLYMRYWLKLDSNIPARDRFRSFWFFKTPGDFRVETFLVHRNGKPAWSVQGDNNSNGGEPYTEYWHIENTTVPVPIDRWFPLEIYWERDPTSGDGRFFLAADNQVLFDFRGKMYGDRKLPINRIGPFMVYSAPEARPGWEWVDDFEIWDAPPCGQLPCGGDGAQPDFSMAPLPASKAVTMGSNATYTVTLRAVNGFNGKVALSLSELPPGVTGSFSPTSVTVPGTSTLTLATSANTAAAAGLPAILKTVSWRFGPTRSDLAAGSYPLALTGASGSLAHTATILLNVTAPVCGASPAGWMDADVGLGGVTGSAGYTNGVFTLKGSGDVSGVSDRFNYEYQAANTDAKVTVSARVASQGNTCDYAKSGVMLRESTNADSAFVFAYTTPGNGVRMNCRPATGAKVVYLAGQSELATPYWVRLVRSGNTFTGYSSPDNVTWTQIAATNVTMAGAVKAGLAVCAFENSDLNTTMFDNVSLATPP